MGKKIIICILFTLTIIVGCNTNSYAKEINTKGLIKGSKVQFSISKDAGEVISSKVNNKNVKVRNHNNTITLKGIKNGKSIVSIITSNGQIKYYVYVAKKNEYKNDNPRKTGSKLIKARKVNHNIELRLKLSNSKADSVECECAYKLQKKNNKIWKNIKANADIADVAQSFAGKGSMEFSLLLSNYYDNLKAGNYRMSYIVNGKKQYINFSIN